MNWQANVEQKEWSGETKLRVWRSFPERIEVLQPFVFKSYDRGRSFPVPGDEVALVGRDDDNDSVHTFLKAMMDAAWKLGIRPTGFEDHNNELKAVRDHLADMRSLALGAVVSGPPGIKIDLARSSG